MMRGDCRTGGIKVTGFATPAARYCAITGGAYTVISASNTPNEQGNVRSRRQVLRRGRLSGGTCTRTERASRQHPRQRTRHRRR